MANPAPIVAAASPVFDTIWKAFGDSQQWLLNMWTLVEQARLPQTAQTLGFAILLVGVVWSGMRIAALGGSFFGQSELTNFLVRLLIAGVIVASATGLGGGVRGLWLQAHLWSIETFARPATNRAADETKNMAAWIGGTAATLVLLPVGVEMLAAKGASATVSAGAKGLAGAGQEVGGMMNWVVALAFPLIMVMNIVVLMTGFTAIMASILLPIVAGAHMLPSGPAMPWTSAWFSSTVGSIFIVMFTPLVFAAALEVGFVGPARAFNAQLQAANQELKKAGDDFANVIKKPDLRDGLAVASPFIPFGTALNKIFGKGGNINNGVGRVVKSGMTVGAGMIGAIIMTVLGIASGVALIRSAQKQISQFVGGLFSIQSGAMPAGAGAALGALGGIASRTGAAIGGAASAPAAGAGAAAIVGTSRGPSPATPGQVANEFASTSGTASRQTELTQGGAPTTGPAQPGGPGVRSSGAQTRSVGTVSGPSAPAGASVKKAPSIGGGGDGGSGGAGQHRSDGRSSEYAAKREAARAGQSGSSETGNTAAPTGASYVYSGPGASSTSEPIRASQGGDGSSGAGSGSVRVGTASNGQVSYQEVPVSSGPSSGSGPQTSGSNGASDPAGSGTNVAPRSNGGSWSAMGSPAQELRGGSSSGSNAIRVTRNADGSPASVDYGSGAYTVTTIRPGSPGGTSAAGASSGASQGGTSELRGASENVAPRNNSGSWAALGSPSDELSRGNSNGEPQRRNGGSAGRKGS